MPLTPFDPPTFGAPAAPTPFTPNTTGVSETPPPARTVITALTGGGSQALDGQLAAYWKLGETVIILADGVAIWQLQAGTQATNTVTGFVRPADFHATLNARVFVRLVWQGKIDAEAAAIAAQAYRDAAQVQANSAGASATQAALVVAGQFKGGAAGNAVPASLVNAGEWVVITADGTSHTINWTRGDRAHWTGVAGSYVRVPGQLLDETRVLAGDNPRATRDVLLSIGGGSGRGLATLGAAGAIGGSPFTVLKRVRMPSAVPAASRGICVIGPNNISSNVGGAFGMELRNDGTLWAYLNGATAADTNRAIVANAATNYAGKWTALAFVRNATGNPSLYFDGAAVVPTFQTGGGAPPGWQGALTSTYFVDGTISATESWDGFHEPAIVILGTLSAAEILEWAQTGRLPTWCESGSGSAVPIYASTFAAGLDGWDATAGYAAGNADNVGNVDTDADAVGSPPSNDWQRSKRTAAAGAGPIGFYRTTAASKFLAGKRHLVTFDIFIPTGSPIAYVSLSGWTGASTKTYTVHPVVAGAVTSIVSEFYTPEDSTPWIRITNAVGTTVNVAEGNPIYLKNYIHKVEAPLARWVVQPCRVCDDAGTNRIPLVLSTGVSPVTDKKTWRIPVTVDMTSVGNKQLLSAALFETPLAQALEAYVDVECAGAPAFSLGDGATATRYTANTAYVAGRARTPVANPFPADAAKTGIYANVTTAHASSAAEKITLCGYRTD